MTRTLTLRIVALAIAVPTLATAYLLGAAHRGSAAASTSLGSTALLAATTSTGTPAGITVSGTGKVTGTPDTVLLSMSVSVTAPNVTQALAAANGKADAVQKSLLAHSVADKDLQTSGMSINPEYSSKPGNPTITGYQVSESLTAKLHDLKKAGDAISAAATAGGDAVRVDGVSLDLGDTSTLVSAARDRAFAEAKAKAEQYAKAAGASLGAVLSITDAIQAASPIPSAGVPQAYDSARSVPIQAGSQDLSVTVTVVFALG